MFKTLRQITIKMTQMPNRAGLWLCFACRDRNSERRRSVSEPLSLLRLSKYNWRRTADTVSLMTQTAYAELGERCTTATFHTEFPTSGASCE